jgi:gliding motility-associated-like protein
LKQFYAFLYTLFMGYACFAQAPTANFSAGQTAGCAPVVINFQDLSTGNPTSWQWNFGNGSTSTQQNPSTTYFTPGTYTVTLTATNTSGSNTLTRTGYITIYGKPAVNFRANDSAGCAPFSVRFSDASIPAANTTNTSWQWDFGNGTGDSVQNPQTSFTATGNYTISLKVTNDKGCFASFSKSNYIQITGDIQIDFTSTGLNSCQPPYPITFTNNSTGPGTLTYLWDFGDGTTSTLQAPSHTYTTKGNYSVSLAVTSSNGCTDTLRKVGYVNTENISTRFSAPDSVCVLQEVLFDNNSIPTPQSSNWTFDDGTMSTSRNPRRTFTAPGIYNVQLVANYGFCTDSFSKPITVLPKPLTQFTASNTIQCKPPLTVNFTDQSTGAVSWQWSFGDSTTSTLQNPSHTYTDFGNYTVRLVTTNAFGCTDTLIKPDLVKIQKPVIRFPSLPQAGCIPYTTAFSANIITLDNITSYLWNFGDGNTSTQAAPTHTYTNQGKYNVTLTIITSSGCTEVLALNDAVVVGRIPVIDFTVDPNPVCAYGTAQFTSVVNEGDTWLWNFGDSKTSAEQSPEHQYSDVGDFTVSLTVTNSGCPKTLTKTAFIRVKPPIAGFTFQNDCANRKRFMFNDQSTGPISWLWDFGDGTTSTLQNPDHVYAAFGDYTVKLTVTNADCSNTFTKSISVFDETPTFTANKRVACKTATITFTPSSNHLSNLVAFDWDFANGAVSFEQNPQVVYSAAGTFTTRLITTDIYGCKDTVNQNAYIRINGPTALFTVPVNQGCEGFTARFANQSTDDGVNRIVSYQWNFGDGKSQTLTTPAAPQHVYTPAGNYTPQLIVTDAAGCKDSLSQPGFINASNPKAIFASADTLNCLGSTVTFSNLSTGQNLSSQWSFGDGNSSTTASPAHLYADTGSYNIQLKITDQYGCSDSAQLNHYINIHKTIASFSVSDSIGGCIPFEVKFTNTSQFFQSSTWQLGNGSSTVTNPTQVYNSAGTYYTKLTVTGRGGCVDTAVQTIVTYDASGATFAYNPFGGCKPLQLNASIISPPNLMYTWDFGDGTIVTSNDPDTLYTYNVFGKYVPKVLLSDSGNCLIPLIGTDTVSIIGVIGKFGWDKRLFCDTGTVVFTDSTTFNDPIVSYTWDFGDGTTTSQTNPTHTYTSPGLYTVSLILQTQQACRDTFQVDQLVKVVQSPSIRLSGDTVICQNGFAKYDGIFNYPDTSQVRWTWQFPNGSSSTMQSPAYEQFKEAGTFNIQAVAVNSSGCADTGTRALLVNPLPKISIPSPQVTPLATPILLPATYTNSITTYTWTPATGLSCTDCPQPIASPKFNTLYKVSVIDENGCQNNANVQVIVLCLGANVFVPNTFSPNGDGSNDIFYVRGKGLNRVKSLRVFNRWGEVVFEKQNFAVNDPSIGWDGTYKGKKLSPDVFVYQVEVFCDNSETVHFEGSIALIR